MATTYERKDDKGRKYRLLDYTTPGGRRVRKSLGPVRALTQREAKIAAGAKDYEVRTGKPAWVPAPLFEDFRAEYLTWRAKKFPRSQTRVAQILNDTHMDVFVGRALSDPELPQVIDNWQVGRLQCVANNSMVKEYRQLNALFNKAIKWNKGITENPCACEGQESEKPKEKRGKPRIAHTQAEAAKMCARPTHGNTWKLGYATGMRREELRQAKRSWFNLDKREVTIQSQAGDEPDQSPRVRVKGRWRTAVLDMGWQPKSGHCRTVPLSDAAIAAYKALTKGRESDDYVIPRIGKRGLSKAFERDAKACGLPGSTKTMRHSFGTRLAEAGVPLPTIQLLMGHADIKTTMIYAVPSNAASLRMARKALAA